MAMLRTSPLKMSFVMLARLLVRFMPDSGVWKVFRIGVESMHNNLKAHRSEVVHKDLKRASENTTRLIYQAVLGVVFLEPSEFIGRKTSLSSVIDTTTQMAYAYLTTE